MYNDRIRVITPFGVTKIQQGRKLGVVHILATHPLDHILVKELDRLEGGGIANAQFKGHVFIMNVS